MAVIDCGKIADGIFEEARARIDGQNLKLHLEEVLVGEDEASKVYLRKKAEACGKLGIGVQLTHLPEKTSQTELLELIDKLNHDEKTTAVIVQFPLPSHIHAPTITAALDAHKDVDGLHPLNVGKLFSGDETGLLPATPSGVIAVLEKSGVQIEGKHAVVIGRSLIVGKPVGVMLLHRHATVSYCHSRTKSLAAHTRTADILVAAVGKPKFVTRRMVKQGAAVIDVGVNRTEKGLVGDVDFEDVKDVAGWITPVPGGIGRMTIAMLMKNIVRAGELQMGK